MSTPKPIKSSIPSAANQTSRSNPQSQIQAQYTDIPKETSESLSKWVSELYMFRPTETEMKEFMDNYMYKGFNRDNVLKQLHLAAGSVKIATELIIVSALRGPQAASRITLSNGKTSIQMGIPASGGKGSQALTLNKIQSATADLAAYYLKSMEVPKRVISDLPAWLQFPSAGSIKLPEKYRVLHIEFSRKFSELIGGGFQEQIYEQMMANSYLDQRLGLFE
jgi:hypothetical protein